jgi:hypothetical protein
MYSILMRRALVLLLAVAVSTSGCMTLVTGGETYVPISVSTDPPYATAACGGQVARTPGVLLLDRRTSHDVQVTAPGCRANTVKIESHHRVERWILSILLNACHGIFTLGITFVLGVALDYGSGSLQELEPQSALVPLFRWETAPVIDLQAPEDQEPPPPPPHR